MSAIKEIYVPLLDEGVDVWRPVQAEHVRRSIYRIVNQPYDSDIEAWQFVPGDEVICQTIESSDGRILAAISRWNDAASIERARQIATRTLAGDYDHLLACHDLAKLAKGLSGVPDSVLEVFIAISSEVDGLPLGPERAYWAAEPLAAKDAQAANYRERVRDVVITALRELLATLDADGGTMPKSSTTC